MKYLAREGSIPLPRGREAGKSQRWGHLMWDLKDEEALLLVKNEKGFSGQWRGASVRESPSHLFHSLTPQFSSVELLSRVRLFATP